MHDVFEDYELEDATHEAQRLNKGLFIAAGAVIAGATLAGIMARRRSPVHRYRKQVDLWLETQLNTLERSIGLAEKQYKTVKREIECAVNSAMHLASKAKKSGPVARDLLSIALDKRLVKMRKRIHKAIDVTETSHVEALQKFYEELRALLTRVPYMHEEPESTTPVKSRLTPA